MDIDINEVIADMMAAMKDALKGDWKASKKTAMYFMDSRKQRLELLASFRLKGEIDDEQFASRLEDEQAMLQSELHTVSVLGKASAQRAANAAIAVLEKAVKAIISAAL